MPKRFLSAAAAAAATMLVGVLIVAQGLDVSMGRATSNAETKAGAEACGICTAFSQLAEGSSPNPDHAIAAFHTGLELWKRVCVETVAACRASPTPFRSSLCPNDGLPQTGPLGRLGRLAGDVNSLAARCRGLTCPQGDCTAATGLRRTLSAAEDRVVRWQAEARLTESDVALADAARKAAEADLIQVVSWAETDASSGSASQTTSRSSAALTTMADQFWRHAAEFKAVADRLAGPGGGPGGPTPWRLNEIGASLGAAGDALKAVADVTPLKSSASGARQRSAAARWSSLGNAVGAAIVNLHNLDVELKSAHTMLAATPTRTCGSAGEGGGIASHLAAARGALDQCLAQVGCSGLTDAENGTSHKVARERAEAEGVARAGGKTLAELASDVDRALAAVRISDAGAVALNLDDASYTVGDVIAVKLKGPQNRCLAAGGWLGLFKLDQSAHLIPEPLARVPIAEGGQSDPVLIGAPLEEGGFALALFGSHRKDTPLGLTSVRVVAASPKDCAGFAGRWQSDFGDLVMSVRAGQLRGTYRRSPEAPPGFLTGTVKGRVFEGVWRSELGAGGTRLVLAKDGRKFSGTWSKKIDAVDGHGLWQGLCAAR